MRPGTVEHSVAGARTALAAARLNDDPTRHHGRSNARERADQGLLEGRLLIVHADEHQVDARWRGEGALHHLGYIVGRWHCTCPARSDQCSHLIALRRVVAVRGSE
jgi:hypothetical protein